MSDRPADIGDALADMLATAERRYFKPGAKLTLVVRRPDDDEADTVVTSDDINEVIAALGRRKEAAGE